MKFNIERLDFELPIPVYQHEGDAGVDLRSRVDTVLEPGKQQIVPTGIKIALPIGYVAHIWDRSGLAAKHAIKTMGGVIDSKYRGEYGVIMINLSDTPYEIKKGDRIAQLIIIKHEQIQFEEVEKLDETSRGSGFGSSGKQ